ncbi:MAG: thymidylate synthase [Bacteroidia bacterium]|nr:thymidylate synthase [Bacteroidia bacterium]MDW8235519.1 thymidylate synthase [Bacteroidia bacterium]
MSSRYEESYLHLLQRLLEAPIRMDRTGTGTRGLFGVQLDVSLEEGFPLLTTKKVHFKSVLYELFWFLRGDTSLKYLHAHGVTIWDEWADEQGNLGPIYGYQWRRWPGYQGQAYDQLAAVVRTLRENPYSRRMLVSAWNVALLHEMRLPPCHVLFQFYAEPDTRRLSIQVYQRSADAFLGLPFNVASYALLLHIVAQCADYTPHRVIFALGDVHLYRNHEEQARLQLSRKPYPLPRIELAPYKYELDAFGHEDVRLVGYQHHPAIPAPVAV